MQSSRIDLVIYDEVDSTNDELRRILTQTEPRLSPAVAGDSSGALVSQSSCAPPSRMSADAVNSSPSCSTPSEVPTGVVGDSSLAVSPSPSWTASSPVPTGAADGYLVQPEPVKAVMALRQTKGRARLGRSWESPPGGLYLSLALDITYAASSQATLSLIAALALREVLAEQVEPEAHAEQIPQDGSALQANQVPLLAQTPEQTQRSEPTKRATQKEGSKASQEHILVKWPNDILCARGKLVGILVESVQLTPGKRVAIIGAGINIMRPAEGASPAAAYLSDLSKLSDLFHNSPNLEEMALKATQSIFAYYSAWQAADYSFAPFAEAYTANVALKGQSVTVSNGKAQKVATGIVQGVDSNGYLLLEDDNGCITQISAGEVTLRSVREPEL